MAPDSPLLAPALMAAVVVALVAAGRAGRALEIGRPLAFLALVSLGGIVALTLTPHVGDVEGYARTCHIRSLSLIGPSELLSVNDRSLNVLLFIPLGFAVGLLPRSRRSLAVAVGAVVLPVEIEMIQLLAPLLERTCQADDVLDNLTGLALGAAAGIAVHLAQRFLE